MMHKMMYPFAHSLIIIGDLKAYTRSKMAMVVLVA